MDVNFIRPNKTLSALNELQKIKKILTRFENNKNVENFLKNNKLEYNNKRKIDLIINNFEENTLFLYPKENVENLFDFLNKSKIEYQLPEILIYKMYLYFYGNIEEIELKSMLNRYSGNSIKNIDFKKFIEENKEKLFHKKYNFPRVLNGEYKILSEVGDLTQKDLKILKYLEAWEQNILKYLSNVEEENLKKIYEKVLKKIDSKIHTFFKSNKKILIKKIVVEYGYLKNIYYKVTKVKLKKGDILIFLQKINIKEEKEIYYLKKDFVDIQALEKINKIKILNEYDLTKVLRSNYSLSKIYLFKQLIKRIRNKKMRKAINE